MKTLTKEEILRKHFEDEFGHKGHGEFMQYILLAMEEYAALKVEESNIKFIPYQLCPKCLGLGTQTGGTLATSIFDVCDVCHGKKVIAESKKPDEINPDIDTSPLWDLMKNTFGISLIEDETAEIINCVRKITNNPIIYDKSDIDSKGEINKKQCPKCGAIEEYYFDWGVGRYVCDACDCPIPYKINL